MTPTTSEFYQTWYIFADDCALYRIIKSAEDASALQNDLDRLYRWSGDWHMDFNVTKCFSISVTLKRNFIASTYYILEDLIEKIKSHKYLGVYICNDMRWNKTVDFVVGKANRPYGLLWRTFSTCPRQIREKQHRFQIFDWLRALIKFKFSLRHWPIRIQEFFNKCPSQLNLGRFWPFLLPFRKNRVQNVLRDIFNFSSKLGISIYSAKDCHCTR